MKDDKDVQKAYEMLAMLHTETMAELVATRQRMDAMSRSWWNMLKHRIKTLLNAENRYDC
jgi:hypothetical protein